MNDVTQKMNVDGKDWFLQSLTDMVNDSDLHIDITLNVGGFLVSGSLVSGKHYFSGFADEFVSKFGDDAKTEQIRQKFSEFGDIYTITQNTDGFKDPSYIHLRDAKFFSTCGEPVPSNKGVWWRGRISEVSGFILGALQVD